MITVLATLMMLMTPGDSHLMSPADSKIEEALAPHVEVLRAGKDLKSSQDAIKAILRVEATQPEATADQILGALFEGVRHGSPIIGEHAALAMIESAHSRELIGFAKREVATISEHLDIGTGKTPLESSPDPAEDGAVLTSHRTGERSTAKTTGNGVVRGKSKEDGKTTGKSTGNANGKASVASDDGMSDAQRRFAAIRSATSGMRAVSRLLGSIPDDASVDALLSLEQMIREHDARQAIDRSADRDANVTVYLALAKLGRRDAVTAVVRGIGGMRNGKPLHALHHALHQVAEKRGVIPPEGTPKQARFRWSLWSRKYAAFFPESLGKYAPIHRKR